MPPAVEAGSPNHWTAREFPLCFVFAFFPSFFFFFGGGMRRITRGDGGNEKVSSKDKQLIK